MNDPIKSIALTIAGEKQLAADKIARNRATFGEAPLLRKPSWIRVRLPNGQLRWTKLKAKLREPPGDRVRGSLLPEHPRVLQQGHRHLHDPGRGVHAALLVLRRRPRPTEAARSNEPANLARTIRDMRLRYVVITSVDRDDLRDGGAQRTSSACIREARAL
jgi:lipoic acid synthetase